MSDDPLQSEREEAQHARDVDLPPAAEADQRRATRAAAEQEEEVDAEVVPEGDGPHPELKEAVDEQLGASVDLAVIDPSDRQEAAVAMAAHDVEKLLSELGVEIQGNALKKWVYELPEGVSGLSVDAVADITQRMAWRGYAKIRMLPKETEVNTELLDRGYGDERYYVATVYAEDQITGIVHSGTSSEPMLLKVQPDKAKKKRAKGQHVDEHDRLFDVFARSKALNKAKRNAFNEFIPTEVEQAVIAMAKGRPALVERIQTKREVQATQALPPIDTPKAKQLEKECRDLYAEIREVAGGRGKVALPPGRYNAEMTNARHSEEAMEGVKLWLEERKRVIPEEYARLDAQAAEKAKQARQARQQRDS